MPANDQLRRAIEQSGLDVDELAASSGVDPKTVRRWIEGRIPHPRHRLVVAQALGRSEYDLWPDHQRRGDRIGEVIGVYPQRSDPLAPDWQSLVRAARQQIDMLGYTLLEYLETPGLGELLRAKARDGIPVRIAIADPTSRQAAGADLEHRPAGTLLRRIREAHERLSAIARGGIGVRQHHAGTSHTILRFDEQMLITLHLYGTPGFQAPLLHVHRQRDYGVFDRFAKHLEEIWHDAAPVGASDLVTPAPDSLVDDLDYVWRPSR